MGQTLIVACCSGLRQNLFSVCCFVVVLAGKLCLGPVSRIGSEFAGLATDVQNREDVQRLSR